MELVIRVRRPFLYVCLAIALAGAMAFMAYRVKQRSRPVVQLIEMYHGANTDRLLRGFYELTESWRFTDRVFAVSLDPTRMERPVYLELDFAVPKELAQDHPAVTLIARVNGVEVGRQIYVQAGRYTFMRHVPLPALRRRPAEVEFEVDQSFTNYENRRVQSLIVVSVGFKEYEQTAEYREFHAKLAREGYSSAAEEIRQKLPQGKVLEFMKLFHVLPVWDRLWFQNVKIIKNPLDLWVMQQIIYEVQPDFIVETGTMDGGSALYWAHTLNGMGLERSRVLTVDISDFTQNASTHFLWKQYVQFFQGSSTDPAIVSAIGRLVKNKRVIVTLDSNHSKEHVLREMRAYGPMVSRGSYLVVEDTHLDGVPTSPESGPGPHAAVEQFLREGGRADFEIDLSRENMIMTFNPGGWLRRK